MIHIGICIPSRNRSCALKECLDSVLLALSLTLNSQIRFTIYVRDNSDQTDPSLVEYINAKPSIPNSVSLHYKSNDIPYHMSDNWNLLAQDAISDSCDYLMFLADRRLLTPSVFRLIDLIYRSDADVIVFDHQSWWLSSSNLIRTREYNISAPVAYPCHERIRDIRNVNFDDITPRLYNCILSTRVLKQFNEWYGSFVGGPFPDINFQIRLSFDTNFLCLRTSIPAIACNARHASLTSSSSGKPNSTSLDVYHCRKSPAPFGFSDEFIFAQCISHLSEAISYCSTTPQYLSKWFSPEALFRSALWELSCPMTLPRYVMLKDNLITLLSDHSHPLVSRLCPSSTTCLISSVHSIPHVSETHQLQPLQHDRAPLTTSSLGQLSRII